MKASKQRTRAMNTAFRMIVLTSIFCCAFENAMPSAAVAALPNPGTHLFESDFLGSSPLTFYPDASSQNLVEGWVGTGRPAMPNLSPARTKVAGGFLTYRGGQGNFAGAATIQHTLSNVPGSYLMQVRFQRNGEPAGSSRTDFNLYLDAEPSGSSYNAGWDPGAQFGITGNTVPFALTTGQWYTMEVIGRYASAPSFMQIDTGNYISPEIDVDWITVDEAPTGFNSLEMRIWQDGMTRPANPQVVDTTPPPPQVVFLNFNGDETIPIDQVRANVIRAVMRQQGITDTWTAEPFDAAEDFGFGSPGRTTNDIISEVVSRVRADFSRFNVSIVTDRPANGDYMQVFVGGAEIPMPGLAGDAEDVDINNTNLTDTAVVLTDNMGQWIQQAAVASFASPAFHASADIRWERTLNWLANVLSHEIGHNLGLRHVENDTTPPDLLNAQWDASEQYLRDDAFQNVDLQLFREEASNLFEFLFPGDQNSVARLAHEVGLSTPDPAIVPQDVSTRSQAHLSVRIIDVFMKDAILAISATLGNADGLGEIIGVPIRELGDLAGDIEVILPLEITSVPIQLALLGKSQEGGTYDLIYGNGFSGASFTPFQSLDEFKAVLLGDDSLSTVVDLVSDGFDGWSLSLQSPISGGVSASVVLVPEPCSLSLFLLVLAAVSLQRWRH